MGFGVRNGVEGASKGGVEEWRSMRVEEGQWVKGGLRNVKLKP